jgi:serine/threonine protein kinase/Tol biopolymer transport system component
MNPKRWQQVNELFATVVDLEIPQRAVFLDQACSNDPVLRSEVESLLASDKHGWSLIEKPAVEAAAPLLANEQPQLTPGQTFSHYEIEGMIGKGGMGEVYLATDKLLNRRIALKLLPADYTRDKERLRRFQQEAQAASALNHPSILTIYELREVDGRQFIATEFVDGETLRQRLKGGPLPLSEALEIAIQIASALGAAHRAGIIHRDIKPENIMLRPDGYVKVLDFGLAKLTQQDDRTPGAEAAENFDISSGLLMGTVKYMSPEQARGYSVDARSDIFSLAVVLYEMISGRAPFEGKATQDVIAAILDVAPMLSNAPLELQALLKRALNKDKEDRYQTVADLLIDLRGLKEKLELEFKLQPSAHSASQALAGIRTPLIATTARSGNVDTASSIEYYIGPIRRHKTGATLMLAAFVIAAIAGGFGLYKFASLRRQAMPFQKIKLTRLTSSGHAVWSVFMPDGKSVLYTNFENKKISLWRRWLDTNNEVQILPATESGFGAFTISPSGGYVYYTVGNANHVDVYQLSLSGGAPTKVLVDVAGRVSVSPDGKQLAYIRYAEKNEDWTLLTANADGTQERAIFKATSGDGVYAPAWSPDGGWIACASYSKVEDKGRIIEVNAVNASQRRISSPEWDATVDTITWLPDKSGLIIAAAKKFTDKKQIWFQPYPTGEVRQLTNDVNAYFGVSISSDGQSLITQQQETQSRIWTAPVDPNDSLRIDFSRARQLSVNRFDGRAGLCFAPDGRIVYESEEGANTSIWIMDANGENRKQLCDNGYEPVVSPDGRYVVFTSTSNNQTDISRINIDGGDLKQLTAGGREFFPSLTPDGKWVLYSSGQLEKPTAWKVSIDGGTPTRLIAEPEAQMPRASPDGNLIAYGYWADKNDPRVAIVTAAGGQLLKTFVAPGGFYPLDWTADGKAVTFSVLDGPGRYNIWAQPISGGAPRQLTNFSPDRVRYYAWSRDGSQLAYSRINRVTDVVLINDLDR